MKTKGLSILQKQIFLVFTLVVVSIGLYAFYAIHNFRQDKLKYIFQTNQMLAQNVGRSLKNSFQALKTDADGIEETAKTGPLSEASTHVLEALFRRNPNFAALAIRDNQHPSTDPQHPFTVFFANPAYVTSHNSDLNNLQLQAMRLIGSAPTLSAAASNTTGTGAGPTNGVSSTFSFVDQPREGVLAHVAQVNGIDVVLFVNKDFIYQTLAESEGFDIFLTDPKNHILASNVDDAPSTLEDHPMIEYSRGIQLESGSRNFQLPDAHGKNEDYIGSFFHVLPQLTLISQVTEFKATAGLRELAFRSLFFALILAGAGITLGYFFSKSLTAPLVALGRATEDLAAGNYQIKLNVKTNDEVKELSLHFQTLALKLNAREKELEKVTELAIKDGMTGAFNNRHFREKFTEWFADAQANRRDLCFAIIDVDHFKKFNDTYGHQQGDEVLKQLVKLVQRTVRPADFVARYGGEEFVILLPDTNVEDGEEVAENVRAAYEAFDIPNLAKPGEVIKSTCSIGVVHIRSGNFQKIDQMIEAADQNLYKCKKGGRNRVIAS